MNKAKYQAPATTRAALRPQTPVAGSITTGTTNPPVEDDGEELGAKRHDFRLWEVDGWEMEP